MSYLPSWLDLAPLGGRALRDEPTNDCEGDYPSRDPFYYSLNLEASIHSLLSFAWTLNRPTN